MEQIFRHQKSLLAIIFCLTTALITLTVYNSVSEESKAVESIKNLQKILFSTDNITLLEKNSTI